MPTAVDSNSDSGTVIAQIPDDEPSVRGRFCWAIVGQTCLPCLLKKDGTKYVSVRIAETKVLQLFLQYFNFEMFSCVSVASFKISEAETTLLNFINKEQCDNMYGPVKFSKERDFIVKLEDLHEYYNFLETCYNKLIRVPTGDFKTNRCGFIRINNESVVPYTVNNDTKYLPLFYFEGDTDHLKVNGTRIGGWDLAYLKFCCKVQGIRNELFASDHCLMISLQDVKSYFPEDTMFEDYWPPQIIQNPPKSNSFTNGTQPSWVQSPMVSSVPSTLSTQMPATYSRQSNVRMNGSSTINSTQQAAVNSNQYNGASRFIWPATTSSVPVSQFNGNRMLDPSMSRSTYAGPKQTRPQLVTTTATCSPPAYSSRAPQPQQYGHSNNTGPAATTMPQLFKQHQQQQLLQQHQVQKQQMRLQQQNLPQLLPQSAQQRVLKHRMLQHQQQILQLEQQQQPQPQHQQQQQQQQLAPLTYSNNGLFEQAVSNPPRIPAAPAPRLLAPLNGKRAASAMSDAAINDEIIDLSSPPASPSSLNCTLENEQFAIRDDRCVAYDNLPPLEPIEEMTTQAVHSSHQFPYTTQTFNHENSSLFCINMTPYAFDDMMIPLVDIVSLFAPTDVREMRYKMQAILKIKLYQPNKTQLQILRGHQKCQSTNEEVPMIEASVFRSHFSQLKYIHDVKPRTSNQDLSKRQKLS